jgi:hypothetical protein
MRVLRRISSVILGVFCALAGVVALGYALDGIEYLKLFRKNMLGGIVGAAVPGVLCASAFYMAVRLIRKRPQP